MKRKKTILILCFLCLFITLFSGCGNNNSTKAKVQDNANESDIWDYTSGSEPYLSGMDPLCMQKKGFYFVNDLDMLYYYDYESQQSIVACSKPDCEHRSGNNGRGFEIVVLGDPAAAEEYKDPTTSCDAYLGYCDTNITFLDERLYYVSQLNSKGLPIKSESLYSVSLDGSNHRLELEDFLCIDGIECNYAMQLTGGKLFYSVDSFDATNDENKEEIIEIDLRTKKKSVFLSYDSTITGEFNLPQMYKGKMYYGNQNYLYQYSPDTKVTKEIYKGDYKDFAFVNDEIFILKADAICSIPLNGGDVSVVFETQKEDELNYDGKFLYLTYHPCIDETIDEAEVYEKDDIITITKLDGTIVDQLSCQKFSCMYGDQNVLLFHYQPSKSKINEPIEWRYQIVILDKKNIGKTHHFIDLITGKEIQMINTDDK